MLTLNFCGGSLRFLPLPALTFILSYSILVWILMCIFVFYFITRHWYCSHKVVTTFRVLWYQIENSPGPQTSRFTWNWYPFPNKFRHPFLWSSSRFSDSHLWRQKGSSTFRLESKITGGFSGMVPEIEKFKKVYLLFSIWTWMTMFIFTSFLWDKLGMICKGGNSLSKY